MVKRNTLTASFCQTAPAGRHHDGGGLMLVVKPTGGRSWIQRVTVNGRRRDMGLGSFEFVSLAEARRIAFENRKQARMGGNPVADKSIPSFSEAMEQVIALHRPTWKGDGSERQWRGELTRYAIPVIGAARVDRIETADVLRCILPYWNERTATMGRVLRRMSTIMQWSIAQGYRGDDPAGEAVRAVLPRCKGETVHRRALPHAELGSVLRALRGDSRQVPTVGLVLSFIALTASRSGEATGACWAEIDMHGKTWTVPPERMKKGREHIVPLSSEAVAVLEEARRYADKSGLVFPSATGRQIAGAILSRTTKPRGFSVHGIRSSFADWAAECSDADRETVERALAHVNRNSTEAAYRRTSLFAKRRDLMEQWGQYLSK